MTGVLLGVPGIRGEDVERAIGQVSGWWMARRSEDATALAGAARAGIGSLCVAAPSLPGMDIDHAALLAETMPLVLLPATAAETARARRWPANLVVPPGTGAVDVLEAVRAVDARRTSSSAPSDAVDNGRDSTGVPVAALTTDGWCSGAGRVVAVWGPPGAPGRSVVATNVAAECAALGDEVLLIDGDPHGGAVASMLALDPGPSSLLTSLRRADDLTRLPATGVAPRWRVLTGVPDGGCWHEFRPARWQQVIDRARWEADTVVVDCGFDIADEAVHGPESAAPTRATAAVTAIAEADVLIIVGSPDAVGLPRLVDAVLRVRQLPQRRWSTLRRESTARRAACHPPQVCRRAAAGEVIVLNRVLERPQAAIEALSRHVNARVDVLIPCDEASVRMALAAGTTLAQVAPTSPMRRVIHDLACLVTNRPAH